jgi:putative SOS response-associated peptidase YedK
LAFWTKVQGGVTSQTRISSLRAWCSGIHPNAREWERTFAIITVSSNGLVAQIHDRMPAILEPAGYDPHDLLITYPSEPMTMWPISTRVNKPENDDPVSVGSQR